VTNVKTQLETTKSKQRKGEFLYWRTSISPFKDLLFVSLPEPAR